MHQSTIFAPRQGTLGSWHPGGPFSIHPGKVKKRVRLSTLALQFGFGKSNSNAGGGAEATPLLIIATALVQPFQHGFVFGIGMAGRGLPIEGHMD
jgi:hypothetical protein